MKKCSYCSMKPVAGQSNCSVCGIALSKNNKDLTKEEKKIAYYCRAMRVTGELCIIFGIFAILVSFAGVSIPDLGVKSLLVFALGIANIYFGIALMIYKKWCYYGAIIVFGYGFVVGLIYLNWFGILFSILLLSYVINPTSRKILLRIC